MKKYILGAVFTLAFAALPAPTLAAGLTSAQIQAILALLSSFGADSSVISNVSISLNGGTPTAGSVAQWCHTFGSSLTIGASGADVTALQTALQKDGEDVTASGYFDEQTASAVSGFQEKYASSVLTPVGLQHGTGYFGASTRTKLNALYGCGSSNQSSVSTTPAPVYTPPVTSTSPAPMLDTSFQILIPDLKGAGTLAAGQTYTLSWTAGAGNQSDSYSVTLVANSAQVYLLGTAYQSQGQFTFTIPTGIPSGSYHIAFGGKAIPGGNSTTFSVVSTSSVAPQIIYLTWPNGGSYSTGNTMHIAWSPSTAAVQDVAFMPVNGLGEPYYVRSAGDPVITTGSYDYVVQPSIPTGSYYVKIGLQGAPTGSFVDQTDLPVTIITSLVVPTISHVSLDMNHGKVTVDGNNLFSLTALTYTANGTTGTLTHIYYSDSSKETVFYMDTYLANAFLGSSASFSVTGPGGTSNTYTYKMPTIDSFSVNGSTGTIANGVMNFYNLTNPTIQWSSSNAASCQASSSIDGSTSTATSDFSGAKPASGSEQLMIGSSSTNPRHLELYCVNTDGVPSQPQYAFIGGKG